MGKTTSIIKEIEATGGIADCHFQHDTTWWDGYTGQSVVVLDDFRGWIPLHLFLKLIDILPVKLPIKGSFSTWFAVKTVYISSNFVPTRWWKDVPEEQLSAITRRISEIRFWTGRDKMETFKTVGESLAWDKFMEYSPLDMVELYLADPEKYKQQLANV